MLKQPLVQRNWFIDEQSNNINDGALDDRRGCIEIAVMKRISSCEVDFNFRLSDRDGGFESCAIIEIFFGTTLSGRE